MANPLESGGQAEKFQHIKTIERPEAIYRIIYDNHLLVHSPDEIGNADAYVTEFEPGIDFSEPVGARAAITKRWRRFQERRGTTRNPRASEVGPAYENALKKMPYYMYDVADTKQVLAGFGETSTYMKAAKIGLGAGAAGYLGKNVVTGEVTKRKFLRNAIAAALAVGGATQLAKIRYGAGEDHEQLTAFQKDIQELSEWLSPETEALDVSYRNAIWAHKLQRIAEDVKQQTGGKKPVIDIQAGAIHTGLERMLKADPAKRLDYIRRMSHAFSRLYDIGDNGIVISGVARFEYSEEEKAWVPRFTGHDPELRKIEEELQNK